jgi:hypothetical protein
MSSVPKRDEHIRDVLEDAPQPVTVARATIPRDAESLARVQPTVVSRACAQASL